MVMQVIVFLAILSIPLIPTFWAILDIPKRKFSTPRKKVIWFFTVSTLPFVGAVFYVLFARRHTVPQEIP